MKKVHIIEEEIEKNPILDRIWIGENSAPNCSVYHSREMIGNNIEYVRKGIEREETIKEVCEWLDNNVYSYYWCDFLQHERGIEKGKLIKDLKKHLKAMG